MKKNIRSLAHIGYLSCHRQVDYGYPRAWTSWQDFWPLHMNKFIYGNKTVWSKGKMYEGKNAFMKNGKDEKCRNEKRRGRKYAHTKKTYERKNVRTKKIYERKNAQTKKYTNEKMHRRKNAQTKNSSDENIPRRKISRRKYARRKNARRKMVLTRWRPVSLVALAAGVSVKIFQKFYHVHQLSVKFIFIFQNHIQMEKMIKTLADYSELPVENFDLPIWPADHEKNIFQARHGHPVVVNEVKCQRSISADYPDLSENIHINTVLCPKLK